LAYQMVFIYEDPTEEMGENGRKGGHGGLGTQSPMVIKGL
jgi:hypothetical protein